MKFFITDITTHYFAVAKLQKSKQRAYPDAMETVLVGY